MASKETSTEVKATPKFAKSELVGSQRYAVHRDILSALLDDSKTYTFDDVDRIIEKFKKTRV